MIFALQGSSWKFLWNEYLLLTRRLCRGHPRPQATLNPFWETVGYRDFDCTIIIECIYSTRFERGMPRCYYVCCNSKFQFPFSEWLLYVVWYRNGLGAILQLDCSFQRVYGGIPISPRKSKIDLKKMQCITMFAWAVRNDFWFELSGVSINQGLEISGFYSIVMSSQTRTQSLFMYFGGGKDGLRMDYGARSFMGRVTPCALHSIHTAYFI